jgi:hypothetical protein
MQSPEGWASRVASWWRTCWKGRPYPSEVDISIAGLLRIHPSTISGDMFRGARTVSFSVIAAAPWTELVSKVSIDSSRYQ